MREPLTVVINHVCFELVSIFVFLRPICLSPGRGKHETMLNRGNNRLRLCRARKLPRVCPNPRDASPVRASARFGPGSLGGVPLSPISRLFARPFRTAVGGEGALVPVTGSPGARQFGYRTRCSVMTGKPVFVKDRVRRFIFPLTQCTFCSVLRGCFLAAC